MSQKILKGQNNAFRYNLNIPWQLYDVAFVYIFVIALSIFTAGIFYYSGLTSESVYFVVLMQLLISIATVAMIYLVVKQKYHLPFFETFGISLAAVPKSFYNGIFISLVIVVSTSLVSLIFSTSTGGARENPYEDFSPEKMRVISVLAIFVAPIVEEIFFRGFMQPAFIKTFGPIAGIFLTAMIFAVSHTQYIGFSTAMAAIFTIGLILGLTRYYSKSVMPGMFAHLFNNFYASLALLN